MSGGAKPTLLVPGSLRLPEGVGRPADLDEAPVDYITGWIRRRMPEYGGRSAALADRVLAVQGRTGSGKSTVMPVAIFRILRSERTAATIRYRGPGVICTQPRVLTAIALANDVSSRPWNPDMVLGLTVGYQTGPVSERPPAGLVYATAGVLAAQLRAQDDAEVMARYRVIIVDEAHERSVDADMLMLLLRYFYQRNAGDPRLPFLVLTSATFDPRRCAALFGLGEANVVAVEGRAYPVETRWPAQGTNDYPSAAVAAVVAIHEANPDDPPERADVLVFVPGADGALLVARGLQAANAKYAPVAGSGPALDAALDAALDDVAGGAGGAGGAEGTGGTAFGDAEGAPPSVALGGGAEGAAPDGGDEGAAFRDAVAGGAGQGRASPARGGARAALGPMLVLVINREVIVAQGAAFSLVFEDPARLPPVLGARPTRRVIVSTIVAETGLTVDTLKYVVDCGWSRSREVYPPWGAEGIVTRPAPRSRVEQRKGRAGRLFPGEFHPLYTQNVWEALDAQQLPDVFVAGYAEAHLAVAREQQRQKLHTGAVPEFRAEDIALPDPPPPEVFLAANAVATALGFLSPRAPLPARWPPPEAVTLADASEAAGPLALARGYGLTTLGHVAAAFGRTSMEGVGVLLAGYVWGAAAADLATAVAMFGSGVADLLTAAERRRPAGGLPPGAAALREALPPFLATRAWGGSASSSKSGGGPLGVEAPLAEAEAAYYRGRLLLADDFAEAVLVFDAFARRLDGAQGSPREVAEWCRGVGLDYAALVEAARRREAVVEEMCLAGLDPYRAGAQRLSALPAEAFTDGLIRFKRCLYDGLRGRLLRWSNGHPDGPGYVTKQGLRVRAPDLMSDAAARRLRALGLAPAASGGAKKPEARTPSGAQNPTFPKARWLLTDQVRLLPAPQTPEEKTPRLLYAASANLVSVLDGYVDVDPEFDEPRAYPREA